MPWIVLLALTVPSAGCAPWPTIATGGAAERHETDWQGILLVERRYVRILEHGGELWAPAKLQEARELLIRARREHAGGLTLDAQASLDAAVYLIAVAERTVASRGRSAGSR